MKFRFPLLWREQKGAALLYATLALVFLAIMGGSVIQAASTGGFSAANQVQVLQAEFNSNAGLEWAQYRLHLGLSPATGGEIIGTLADADVTALFRSLAISDEDGMAFAGGSFSVSADPQTGKITSTGKVDDAQATHSLYAAFAASCFEFLPGAGFDFPSSGSGTMTNVSFQKLETDAQGRDCADTIVMSAVRVSWSLANSGEAMTSVFVDGAMHYGNESGMPSGEISDLEDVTLADALVHVFDVVGFAYPAGAPPVAPQTFTIQAYFADGSTASANYVYTAVEEGSDATEVVGVVGGGSVDGDIIVTGEASVGTATGMSGAHDADLQGGLSGGVGSGIASEPAVEVVGFASEDVATHVIAHVNFDYTLYDHTEFDDLTGASESYAGDYPCEVCEGSLYIRFLDASGETISGGLCNDVTAQNADDYDSSFEHDCLYEFDVASLDEVKSVEFEGYGGISVHIDRFFAHLYHEDGDEKETTITPAEGEPCLYDTETGIVPGAYHYTTYDTGSHDYSFQVYDHKCDDLGYGYVRSSTYELPERAR